jgi:hypothetical protein
MRAAPTACVAIWTRNFKLEDIMRTFQDFVKSDIGRACVNREFAGRLESVPARILSLNNLLRFARERWPASYPRDYRTPTVDKPHGREAMGELWAKYLEWCDSGVAYPDSN